MESNSIGNCRPIQLPLNTVEVFCGSMIWSFMMVFGSMLMQVIVYVFVCFLSVPLLRKNIVESFLYTVQKTTIGHDRITFQMVYYIFMQLTGSFSEYGTSNSVLIFTQQILYNYKLLLTTPHPEKLALILRMGILRHNKVKAKIL